MPEQAGALAIAGALNEACPRSGKPISADSLTLYRGAVVGFCNTGCRDKFAAAVDQFERALAGRGDAAQIPTGGTE